MSIKHEILVMPTLAAIVLVACTTISTQGPLYFQREKPSSKIPLKDFNIAYKDRRQGVNDRKLHIPTFTVSGNQDRIQPKINPEWDRMFTKTINRIKEPGNGELLILIDILEAYQAFKAGKYAEIEYAGAKLKISVLERQTMQIVAESNGACWGSKKTLDASQESIKAMFWDALEMAFLDALNGIPRERLVVAENTSADLKRQAISPSREPPGTAAVTPPAEKAISSQPRAIHTSSLNQKSPSVEIYKVTSEPSVVQPGGKFDLVVEYAVRDTSTQADQIPVGFSYSILRGNKSLFESEPVLLHAENGRRMRRIVHLTAVKKKGNYLIKTALRYNHKIAGEIAEFKIE